MHLRDVLVIYDTTRLKKQRISTTKFTCRCFEFGNRIYPTNRSRTLQDENEGRAYTQLRASRSALLPGKMEKPTWRRKDKVVSRPCDRQHRKDMRQKNGLSSIDVVT